MTSLIEDNQERWKNLARVAWIRPGAIGDLVVGLASLAEIPRFFPKARVTVVGPKMWIELLEPARFPYVERLAIVERKGLDAQLFEPRGGRWQSVGERKLRGILGECDAAVNTNIDSYRYGFEAWRAGVAVRIGSAPAAMAWLYTHASPYFGKDPLIHERDGALLLLEYATPGLLRFMRSVEGNRANLDVWVEQSRLVREWRKLGLPNAKIYDFARAERLTARPPKSYVLVNPTASRREKTWPTDRMRQLLDECAPRLHQLGLEALIIGAPSETDWLREVAGSAFRMVQPASLAELQDVVAGARCLITNGSSMQFIAGTTQTPVLTIFGRGQPVIWGPVGPRDRVVRAKFEGSERGQTFAGFEEEARIYRTIEVSDVKGPFLELVEQTPS